jgi:hypothetical protein
MTALILHHSYCAVKSDMVRLRKMKKQIWGVNQGNYHGQFEISSRHAE